MPQVCGMQASIQQVQHRLSAVCSAGLAQRTSISCKTNLVQNCPALLCPSSFVCRPGGWQRFSAPARLIVRLCPPGAFFGQSTPPACPLGQVHLERREQRILRWALYYPLARVLE